MRFPTSAASFHSQLHSQPFPTSTRDQSAQLLPASCPYVPFLLHTMSGGCGMTSPYIAKSPFRTQGASLNSLIRVCPMGTEGKRFLANSLTLLCIQDVRKSSLRVSHIPRLLTGLTEERLVPSSVPFPLSGLVFHGLARGIQCSPMPNALHNIDRFCRVASRLTLADLTRLRAVD